MMDRGQEASSRQESESMYQGRFENRAHAGRLLGEALKPYGHEDCIVLALPRGGVIVGYEVARILNKPLDVLVVRKLGAPTQPELGMGAIAPGNVLILNRFLIDHLGISHTTLESIIHRERTELERRLKRYRGNRPFPALSDKTVILVDDGLATGATARAAIQAAKALNAGKVVLAVPVGAEGTVNELRREVDELVCLESPYAFESVSLWYWEFPQNSDTEVIKLLEKAWNEHHSTMTDSRIQSQ